MRDLILKCGFHAAVSVRVFQYGGWGYSYRLELNLEEQNLSLPPEWIRSATSLCTSSVSRPLGNPSASPVSEY